MMSGTCGFLNDTLNRININLLKHDANLVPTKWYAKRIPALQNVVGFRIRSPWHHLVVVRIGKVFLLKILYAGPQ